MSIETFLWYEINRERIRKSSYQ